VRSADGLALEGPGVAAVAGVGGIAVPGLGRVLAAAKGRPALGLFLPICTP
jgi:hypothetical protein